LLLFRRTRARGLLLTVGVIAALIITSACYAPTEVTIVLSTDLGCVPTPRTAVFKGKPERLDLTPETETASCKDVAGSDSEIGSLVIVPSGDVNGRAAVKAMLTQRTDKSPASCEQDPADCIIATRSFSFVAHESRRVPIRLLKECLGVKCPAGKTCVGPNTCASTDVSCYEAGNCPPEDAGGAVVIVEDASRDASKPLKCVGLDGKGIITTSARMPSQHLAVSSPKWFFFWDNDLTAARPIVKVPQAGGTKTTVFTTTGGSLGSGPLALSVLGNDGVYARTQAQGVTNLYFVEIEDLPETAFQFPDNTGLTGMTGALNPQTVYASSSTGIWSLAHNKMATFVNISPKSAKGLVASLTTLYASRGNTVVAITRATNAEIGAIDLAPVPAVGSVVFSSDDDGAVFAAGSGGPSTGSTAPRILALSGTNGIHVTFPTTFPIALATDATHVYWTDGSAIRRARKPSNTPGFEVNKEETILPADGSDLDHVAVDADCIYYWRQASNGLVELRVMAKPVK